MPSTIEVSAHAARATNGGGVPCMTMPFFSLSALVGSGFARLIAPHGRLNAYTLYCTDIVSTIAVEPQASFHAPLPTLHSSPLPRFWKIHYLKRCFACPSVARTSPADPLPCKNHSSSHLWNTHHALTHVRHATHTRTHRILRHYILPSVFLPHPAGGGDFVLQSSFASLAKPSAKRDSIF